MEDMVIMSREKADALEKEIERLKAAIARWHDLYEENCMILQFVLDKTNIKIEGVQRCNDQIATLSCGGGVMYVPLFEKDKEIVEKLKEILK